MRVRKPVGIEMIGLSADKNVQAPRISVEFAPLLINLEAGLRA
jgi:hypothetical protein